MAFLETLSIEQKQNVAGLIDSMKRNGITNTMMQAGILAVISKESSFIPKSERDYSKTDNARIRSIFGSRVKHLDENELTALKRDPKAFFDLVYGGRYENAPDEGYKYRGRGFNQLTFKSNYRKTGKRIGVDLVKNPDRLNEVAVATEAVISFFKEKFSKAPKATLALYGMVGINDAPTIEDAVNAAYHANTGWGKTREQILREKTGGYAKAVSRVKEFYRVTSGILNLQGNLTTEEDKPGNGLLSGKPLKHVCVTAGGLNVRKKPGVKHAKVTDRDQARAGEILAVYEVADGWYRISPTRQHWVAAQYCVDVRPARVMASTLNIRTGPHINAPKSGTLKKGEEVYVQEEKNGWCKIAPDENWVSCRYLTR